MLNVPMSECSFCIFHILIYLFTHSVTDTLLDTGVNKTEKAKLMKHILLDETDNEEFSN